MGSERFVHLHVHSHYSLLDGAALLEDLVDRTRELGMTALAVTDHGNMFGAVEFYKKASRAGIKPIIGYEAYVAPGSRFNRDSQGMKDSSRHITLLVQNETGYKNLIKLASLAFIEGFYYRPRIDKELLAAHSEGLICLSGCLQSELCNLLVRDEFDQALKVAEWFRDVFGPDRYYLEIQDSGLEEQATCNPLLAEIAKKLSLKLAATNDIHYLNRDDHEAHDILLCINTGRFESDEDRLRFPNNEFYFKSPEQMREAFADFPDAVTNTADIADMCEFSIDFKQRHYPTFDPPAGKTNEAYLREMCEAGLRLRYSNINDDIRARLDRELDVICGKGYADYFLIVWDFVHFARQKDIPVGPGRGSAVGSLASFCLGITDVDPIRYNLLFERFMDLERMERPDFDIDFCELRRAEVINYVREKYGADCVAPIITFGTMAARGVIRDVGRAMQVPLAEGDKLAKKVPSTLGITLDEALQQEPELRQTYETEPWAKRLFDIAGKLEGRCRHASKHPAGIIIADKPLIEYIPLYKSDGDITTQYAWEICDELGMLKADFLSLRTLTIMDTAIKLIAENRGVNVNLAELPLDDKKVYEMLGRGETKGIFQLESGGFRDMLVRVMPERIEDLIPLVSLYRPGPLGSGLTEEFIRRAHGRAEVAYDHPLLEPILEETHGIMIYQEQIMQILNTLGGIPLARAYKVIQAIGKKQADVIEQSREQFIEGARANHVPEKKAVEIFDRISYFASYGFNKSHSAAYAHVTYQTAYLKTRFPHEFMAALLTCEMGSSDKVVEYVEECKRLDIKVLPPSVSESSAGFSVVGDCIRFGLGAIKNVGLKAIDSIVDARTRQGPFRSIFDLCERIDLRLVNKNVLEALIKAGALDCLNARRAQLWAVVDHALQFGVEAHRDRQRGQRTLADFFQQSASPGEAETLPNLPEWPEPQLLTNEKQALGFYISSHPLAKYEELFSRLSTAAISGLSTLADGQSVALGCMIADYRRRITRNGPTPGRPMAHLTLEDLSGTCEGVLFPESYSKFGHLVEKDRVVLVKGTLDLQREPPNIRINEMAAVEKAAKRLADDLTVEVAAPHADDRFLYSLRDVIDRHRGRCGVCLLVHDPSGRDRLIRLSGALSVDPSDELIREIRSLAPGVSVSFGRASG